MSTKPKAANEPQEPKASAPSIEADELHEPEVAAWIARNREVLDESIARSDAELAEGAHSLRSVGDIIRDGRRRHPRSA